MNNVKVLHEIADPNGWVVRADTVRFGRQQIMCEGTYDDCIRYVLRPLKNPLTAFVQFIIHGYDDKYGVFFDNKEIRVYRNGFEKHLDGIY